MDLAILKAEITGDPLARGYAGMTDLQITTSLNVVDRTRQRATIPVSEVVRAFVASELDALTTGKKANLQIMLMAGTIEVNNTNVRAVFFDAFASGSATRTALIALADETVSRGEELGIGFVSLGNVQQAKAMI